MLYLDFRSGKRDMEKINIIGGGLAGVEASWQVLKRGGRVRLYEMKPVQFSKAHKKDYLAELVCSNSFKSKLLSNASGLLKEEMKLFGSLVMESGERFQVPAGEALAVDRDKFSAYITERLCADANLELVREEVKELPDGIVIIATGPLTSQGLSEEIERITGKERLYFYDAIAPIVYADSINLEIGFKQSRWERGGDDYINCPMSEDEYERFYQELLEADTVQLREFEELKYFEGCVPIEELARRGKDTMRYGPLKPVGLKEPKTGKEPFAVVQLRQEDISGELYGLVGFQTKLKYPEQERIFRMIPGLENAEFARLGSMHRNTYIDSPRLLNPDLSLKNFPNMFFAGQITGVEGYLESSACGIMAGIYALARAKGISLPLIPKETAIGSLVWYVSSPKTEEFVPMNINWGLFPGLEGKFKKKDKRALLAKRALEKAKEYVDKLDEILKLN